MEIHLLLLWLKKYFIEMLTIQSMLSWLSSPSSWLLLALISSFLTLIDTKLCNSLLCWWLIWKKAALSCSANQTTSVTFWWSWPMHSLIWTNSLGHTSNQLFLLFIHDLLIERILIEVDSSEICKHACIGIVITETITITLTDGHS